MNSVIYSNSSFTFISSSSSSLWLKIAFKGSTDSETIGMSDALSSAFSFSSSSPPFALKRRLRNAFNNSNVYSIHQQNQIIFTQKKNIIFKNKKSSLWLCLLWRFVFSSSSDVRTSPYPPCIWGLLRFLPFFLWVFPFAPSLRWSAFFDLRPALFVTFWFRLEFVFC